MSEDEAPLYTDEYIAKIVSGPSLFSAQPLIVTNPRQVLIDKIEKAKKKHVRTELHARMLTEYLKAGIIPQGLQVRNVPGIFREDPKFKGKFSNISTTCSRHWMVLGVETAIEHAKIELQEIEALEKELLGGDGVTEAKVLLDKLNKTVAEFNTFELKKKADKVTKDFKFFTKEKAYPYLREDFYNTGGPQNRQNTWGRFKRNQPVTFSESSGSSDDSDPQPSTSRQDNRSVQPFLERGGKAKNRPWHQYAGERQTRRKYYQWGPQPY